MTTSSYIYDLIIRVHDILSNSFDLEKKTLKVY